MLLREGEREGGAIPCHNSRCRHFFPSIWSLSFPCLNGIATTAQALNTKGNSKASLKKEQCSDASVNMVSERCPNTAHRFINEGYAATSSRKINTY